MGSFIEINDTLKLTRSEGFPANVSLGGRYQFRKKGRRLYHLRPVRVFLVEEVDGSWDMVGHAFIDELGIDAVREETYGVFEVTLLYTNEHRRFANLFDAPSGKGVKRDPDTSTP
jgi:hypothetical protein